MSPHHRQKGDPCPPRDSSCTLLVAGVVLFVLGVLFFASVNCAQTWRGVTICGFGDPYSWREDPGLGFMVWGSWSGVHGLAAGGLMVVRRGSVKGQESEHR